VSLSVLRDSVPESNAAMLILVDLDGEVAVDITVTVQTHMGTGRHCVMYVCSPPHTHWLSHVQL